MDICDADRDTDLRAEFNSLRRYAGKQFPGQKTAEVQRYAWPLGSSSPEDTVTQIYAEKFAEEVDRLSGGSMKISVYPNSVLGGDRELLESCKDGDIPFVVQNTAPQVTFMKDTAVFDMPALFENDR